MKREVIVLGCGPAGLLAAHAANQAGYNPTIYSRKERSRIGGAQYLHRSIPGLSMDNGERCRIIHKGREEEYAFKVYGQRSSPTSWSDLRPGIHRVWNMRTTYDRLWEMYEPKIQEAEITSDFLELLLGGAPILSTVPAKALVREPDRWTWQSQTVYIQYGQDLETEAKNMEIVYSGLQEEFWYRQSNLFGWKGIEYGYPVDGAIKVTKPIATDCPGIIGVCKLGRYGKWRKGVLIHHAYEEALKILGGYSAR